MIRLKRECRVDPACFNFRALGRSKYWWRQAQICESVRDFATTLVPAGNGVGKSFCAAGVILWFLHNHKGCKVICTAPTQTSLSEVLWAEIKKAQENSRIPLAGRVYRSPLKIDKAADGLLLALSTTTTERLSGHHEVNLLAVVDEGSGVAPEIWEAIDSLNPSRLLVLGNPLRPDGQFYERCTRAKDNPSPLVNLITVPSTESPDIKDSRSPRGLADATFLARARNDYGEGSLWWKTHIDAIFPDSGDENVIPRSWIDRAARAEHVPCGQPWMAIDLAEGAGGDRTVILTRDNNGILALEWSSAWTLEAAAAKAAAQARRFNVPGHRASWDVGGCGADFEGRLRAAGIDGAHPYRGGSSGGKLFTRLRAAAAWALRQRLDPGFKRQSPSGKMVEQPPFAIRPEWVAVMRAELQGLRYTTTTQGIELEKKDDFKKRLLGQSPDFADALAQSFAFDDPPPAAEPPPGPAAAPTVWPWL